MNTFTESGLLPELIKATLDLGFDSPMPIQQLVIPEILESDRDIIALAQTGTGKTAAFGLPLIHRLDLSKREPQVLILSPTRELCMQIASDLSDYGKHLKNFSVLAIYGGASIDTQIRSLHDGVHIVVATPGRINDVIRRNKINLKKIQTIVLDEADEMLNMGFAEDLKTILETIPSERRVLLFSATMPKEIATIAANYMTNPVELTIGIKNAGAENVKHNYYVINSKDRYLTLKRIADFYPDIYGIIFCRTRRETAEVAEKLMKDGYNADALHGDLSQTQRDYVMNRFRCKNLQMLVATDVAARGIDVDNLTHIINYNLPDDNEIYTHRSGRTGRVYNLGISISLINARDLHRITQIEKLIHQKFERKNVPTGVEVCKMQLLHMVSRLENVEVNDQEITNFLPDVMKKMETFDRDEIIKRFVSLEFNRFLDYYKNAPDLNSHETKRSTHDDDNKGYNKNVRNNDYTVLRISIGSLDGLNVQKLMGIVNDSTRNRKIGVGKVIIKTTFTLFEIENSYVEDVLDGLKDKSFAERKLSAKEASAKDQNQSRPPSSFNDRNRSHRSSSSFGDKNRNFREKYARSDKPKRENKRPRKPGGFSR
jgi:ATP-dependent RNA helicase DeaD